MSATDAVLEMRPETFERVGVHVAAHPLAHEINGCMPVAEFAQVNSPYFHDDDAAREYLQSIRWPDGPVCPHCGVIGNHYQLEGKAHRKGLYKCCENEAPATMTCLPMIECAVSRTG